MVIGEALRLNSRMSAVSSSSPIHRRFTAVAGVCVMMMMMKTLEQRHNG